MAAREQPVVATPSAAGGITNGDAGGSGGCSLRNSSSVSMIARIINTHTRNVQKKPRRLPRESEINKHGGAEFLPHAPETAHEVPHKRH